MAKNKRAPSSSQTNKHNIEVAKYLKKIGALSKQANLHQGRYISKSVLKKVRDLEFVYINNYKAEKVTKDYLAKAKAQGFTTVGNRVIIPKGQRARKRIDAGMIVGVIPVKGGTMESVILPYDDLTSLMGALQRGELDAHKMQDEQFMFSLYGNMSYLGLPNGEMLAEYLARYDSAMDTLSKRPEDRADYVKNLTLYRLNRDDIDSAVNRGQNRSKKKSQLYTQKKERLKRLGSFKFEKVMKAKAQKQLAYREQIKNNDPEKYAAQKEKARLRAKKSREKSKRG